MNDKSKPYKFTPYSDTLEKSQNKPYKITPYNQPQEPKEKSLLEKIVDIDKSLQKGLIEGVSKFGRMLGPLPTFESEEELQKKQEEALNKLIPTEDESLIQRSFRRGARELPSMLAFPGAKAANMLPRTTIAGFLGEGAKDLGAPEWAQTALELTAFMTPSKTKKILESGNDKALIATARKFGLTDEQITPLIQSEFKQKWLSKIAKKTSGTQKVLSQTNAALGESYNILRKSPQAQSQLSGKARNQLMNEFSESFFDMPASVRNKVKEDFRDLISAPITGDTLINFYQDINAAIGGKTKKLATLKDSIKTALMDISPDMGQDFENINKLYTKYSKISQRLTPTLTDQIVRAGEILGLGGTALTAIYTGGLGPIGAIVGEMATRKLAQQMLLNPRLQQLPEKIIQTTKANKFQATKKLLDLYAKEIEKEIPEIAKELRNMTVEDLKKLFNHQQE